jgi:predicted HAD superfamily hydrolase
LLHTAVRKIHIFSAEIAENVTWSHLQEIVNRKWATFQILGFEINDTLLLQKLIGISIGVFIANDLVNTIQF